VKIVNKAGVTELYIYEDIGTSWFGGIGAKDVIAALKEAKNDVLVRINSRGEMSSRGCPSSMP